MEIRQQYSATATLTVTGLTTLANAASATSATVDNSTTNYLDVLLEVVVTTAASGTLATGFVEIWAKGSIDNADFDDDANDKWIGSIGMGAAGAQTRKRILSVASGFSGTLPPYFQIRIRNASGGAFTAGTVSYVGVTAQSV
jgi:hypothetical protein